MIVWNTIDDRYLCFGLYRETYPNVMVYFCSVFSRTVWNTIDDRYSNFVLYIETYPHFLVCFFSFFKAYSVGQCGILILQLCPLYSHICWFLPNFMYNFGKSSNINAVKTALYSHKNKLRC